MSLIRPTLPDDAGPLAELINAIARERRFLALTQGFDPATTRDFICQLANAGGIQLVVEAEGTALAGWIDIQPWPFEGMQQVGRLGMGIAASQRGQGLGRRLLQAALSRAFAQGLARVELEVFASNHGAVALYRQAGFREEGCRRQARQLDGHSDDILLFGLLREEYQPG